MEFLGGGFEARAGAQKDTQCFAKSLVVIRAGCERTEHLGDPNRAAPRLPPISAAVDRPESLAAVTRSAFEPDATATAWASCAC